MYQEDAIGQTTADSSARGYRTGTTQEDEYANDHRTVQENNRQSNNRNSSPQSDNSYSSHRGTPQSDVTRASRQTTITSIFDKQRAIKFDGTQAIAFMRWKQAIQREVQGLNLLPGEWLELLSIRTTGKAKKVVQQARSEENTSELQSQ
mgnify:CR=1 FL=1